MAQTVIARVPFLNRLRNFYEKTVNIAPLGGIFNLLERCPVTDPQVCFWFSTVGATASFPFSSRSSAARGTCYRWDDPIVCAIDEIM
jgi:hypothetical protein